MLKSSTSMEAKPVSELLQICPYGRYAELYCSYCCFLLRVFCAPDSKSVCAARIFIDETVEEAVKQKHQCKFELCGSTPVRASISWLVPGHGGHIMTRYE